MKKYKRCTCTLCSSYESYAAISTLLVGGTACLLVLAIYSRVVSATEVNQDRDPKSFKDKDELYEHLAKLVTNAALKNDKVKRYMVLGIGVCAFLSAAIVAIVVSFFR